MLTWIGAGLGKTISPTVDLDFLSWYLAAKDHELIKACLSEMKSNIEILVNMVNIAKSAYVSVIPIVSPNCVPKPFIIRAQYAKAATSWMI